MFDLGAPELILILVIALVVFGGKRIPEIGESLGKGIRNFKKGLQSIDEDDKIKEIAGPYEAKEEASRPADEGK